MSETPVPFRQMRGTIAVQQAAVLPILATLDAKALDADDLKLVTTIILARDKTHTWQKNNPTYGQMLTLCGVWFQLAERAKSLIPDGQPALMEALEMVLKEAQWVKELDPNTRITKVVES